MGESCIYRGHVRHRRFSPVPHEFRYELFMLYFDLAELDQVFAGRWLWSTRRPAVARFRRRDHLGPPGEPLDRSVRRLVEERTGWRPRGAIRLLTHPRYFGYGFNPISLFFCFDERDDVGAVVAEVSNTPWGERHCYVLRPPNRVHGTMRFESPKELHVSPFIDMEVVYRWSLNRPGPGLTVRIENLRDGAPFFDASLVMRRREITGTSLAQALLRFPWMTARIITAIHWQAARLWWKGVPVHPHPGRSRGATIRKSA